MTARIMAEELYHAFTVISGMRYRVIVIAEQRVNERWVQMSTTELSTFSLRNRNPRMPSRPPPPAPAGPSGSPGTSRGATPAFFGCARAYAGRQESMGAEEEESAP
jgi:hypothetical protein